jgi:hypothetical protein
VKHKEFRAITGLRYERKKGAGKQAVRLDGKKGDAGHEPAKQPVTRPGLEQLRNETVARDPGRWSFLWCIILRSATVCRVDVLSDSRHQIRWDSGTIRRLSRQQSFQASLPAFGRGLCSTSDRGSASPLWAAMPILFPKVSSCSSLHPTSIMKGKKQPPNHNTP